MPEYSWLSFSVNLRCVDAPKETRRGHAAEVTYALVKENPLPDGCRLACHGRRIPLSRQLLRRGAQLDLEFALIGATEPIAAQWLARFVEYAGRDGSNFAVLGTTLPTRQRMDIAPRVANVPDELCLDVLTPLRFARPRGAPRTRLTAATLFALLTERVQRLFGDTDMPRFDPERLDLLTHYLHYEEYRHVSDSARQKRREAPTRGKSGSREGTASDLQYYNGAVGLLYLRGDLGPVLPWLELLSHLHLDDARVSILGHFIIRQPAPAVFASSLADVAALRGVATEVLRNYDAAEAVAESSGLPIDEGALCTTLAAALAAGDYQPAPYQSFAVPKPQGGTRTVERLQPRDLIAQQRLVHILAPVLEHELAPGAFGFRKGLSREDAIAAIRTALRNGYRQVVKTDIEDFFPSVDHGTMLAAIDRLVPRADAAMRALLSRIVTAPTLENGVAQPRLRGLAQGSPLSPLLANLYLDRFDWALQESAVRIVRYADDIVLLCRSREDAERVLHHAEGLLADLHLHLAPAKTAVSDVAAGFDVLGEHIDERAIEDPIEALLPQKKPVIVTEPYVMLGANGDALDVRRAGSVELSVPFRRISEIIAFGRDVISTTVLEQCIRHGVPLSIALDSGHHVATFIPDSRGGFEFSFRHGQWRRGLSATAELALACTFVAAKLDNYSAYIRQRYAAGDNTVLAKLKIQRQALNTTTTMEAARGHEGNAARAVFAWLQQQIKPALRRDFAAERRSRGGPDRLNSLLNFGYFLLFARLNTLVRSHGLNPYLGVLHDSEENYETLVADFQEPFRVHVDRLIINLINYESIGAKEFVQTPRGLRLTRPAARIFALSFERMLGEKIGNVILRDAMLAQVRALRRCVLGEGPFWVYRWKAQPMDDYVTGPMGPTVRGMPSDSEESEAGAAGEPVPGTSQAADARESIVGAGEPATESERANQTAPAPEDKS